MVRYRKRSIAETISAVVINWLCEKPAGDGVREGRGEGGRKWEEEVGGWYGGVENVRSCADMNLLSLVWSGDWWENLWGIWEPDSRARWELEVVSLLHCPTRSHPSLSSYFPVFPSRFLSHLATFLLSFLIVFPFNSPVLFSSFPMTSLTFLHLSPPFPQKFFPPFTSFLLLLFFIPPPPPPHPNLPHLP